MVPGLGWPSWITNRFKSSLNWVANIYLAPYVENLDVDQISGGISSGKLTLTNLRFKKGALDKLKLPVDVLEGHLGELSARIPWFDLGNSPLQLIIKDVYMLVIPNAHNDSSIEEDIQRALELKLNKLANAEGFRASAGVNIDKVDQNQGLYTTIFAKVINNIQVTVENIHIRYEDRESCPQRPFAAGLTLAGFRAYSTDENWKEAFIPSTEGTVHKLAHLESLALYFDTETRSLAGLPEQDFKKSFRDMISDGVYTPMHQFILKPISGEGRLTMLQKQQREIPRYDAQLIFDEIGFSIDNDQYRDAISVVDMYHVYARQWEYKKYLPTSQEFGENRSKALLRFAGRAILDRIHEKNRQWTWAHFKERRDDRHAYIALYKRKLQNTLLGEEIIEFDELERKLSYEDIRFYRSISRSELKKEKKKLEEERKQQQPKTWSGWLWGSNTDSSNADVFGTNITDEQRKELYEALDFDEKESLALSFEDRESIQFRIGAKLTKGSMTLQKHARHGQDSLISVMFDNFKANVITRPDNFDLSLSLGDFGVLDGTTPNSIYERVVRVKNNNSRGILISNPSLQKSDQDTPFFSLGFEYNPLDKRADNALTVAMRSLEIIYHRGYVEAIYAFFKPPESQLQSVEALLSAAGETLEGLRKETRAGLEYALQTHKTIDVKLDMHAPIILVPESVYAEKCRVLVVDAGRISVESNLANKQTINEIHQKRHQAYTDDDYRQLEALMYDRFSIKFQDAQFLLGNDIESCRKALEAEETDQRLHLVERINLDFALQNSIVPDLRSLTRFKISGNLPALRVNFSDAKYKTLMRLIEVAIPRFNTDEDNIPVKGDEGIQLDSRPVAAFQLSRGIFGPSDSEYHTEEADDTETTTSDAVEMEVSRSDKADEASYKQFEFSFQVDVLEASLWKSTEATEKHLGNIRFNDFFLTFTQADARMEVDITLGSLSGHLFQPGKGKPTLPFVSSSGEELATEEHLLIIHYLRVAKDSPSYQGVDQSVQIKFSTLTFQVAPEPLLSLYDFVMTAFTSDRGSDSATSGENSDRPAVTSVSQPLTNTELRDNISVTISLSSVKVVLIDASQLATISMSTADIKIALNANGTLQVTTRLGNLSITDDSSIVWAHPPSKQLLSIEGDEFAEFHYETYSPQDRGSHDGLNSMFKLRAGSLKLYFLEQPSRDLLQFLTRLVRLKGIYDAAAQAAVQRAPDVEKMGFDIVIKTPILVFPDDVTSSQDALIMRLGEVSAANRFTGDTCTIRSSLRGIQLASSTYTNDDLSTLKIIEDIEITSEVVQSLRIERKQDLETPDYATNVSISDVKLNLTQAQYVRLLSLSQSVPRVFASPSDAEVEQPSLRSGKADPDVNKDGNVGLEQNLKDDSPWNSFILSLQLNSVKLRLYDGQAHSESQLKNHGIAQFELIRSTLQGNLKSNGSYDFKFKIGSVGMKNTRPGTSRFRDIVNSDAKHDEDQFYLDYTMSVDKNATANIALHSPRIIFTLDPIFALSGFFLTASPATTTPQFQSEVPLDQNSGKPGLAAPTGSFHFSVILYDVSVSLLENEQDVQSQAVDLKVQQVALSQHDVLDFTVTRLGMSLGRKGYTSDMARFLDDLDFNVTLDRRTLASGQSTVIQMVSGPIILRASYRDIHLISVILNRAIELSTKSDSTNEGSSREPEGIAPRQITETENQVATVGVPKRKVSTSGTRSFIKEKLQANFERFELILIADLYEIPILHLATKQLNVAAEDWSTQIRANTSVSTVVKYMNMKNSHWEPLIDPWTFQITAEKDPSTERTNLSVVSKKALDVNITPHFIELGLNHARAMQQEGNRVLQKARGSDPPYRIRNRTGCELHVWVSDVQKRSKSQDVSITKIHSGETVDWRFDDWKTMRELVSVPSHDAIGVKFEGLQHWDTLKSLPVDKEGVFVYTLAPRTSRERPRLVCDVAMKGTVKVVTLRSTVKVENQTFYTLELTLVDARGNPLYGLEKLSPGDEYAVPIEAVISSSIRVRPDQGFGYKFSGPCRWQDLMLLQQGRSISLTCNHANPQEPAFQIHALPVKDKTTSDYPRLSLKLRAFLELENLLPYNIEFKMYNRVLRYEWKSYLRSGGIMPFHAAKKEDMILLNAKIQDAGYYESEFAIVNPGINSEHPREFKLGFHNVAGPRLELRLNYIEQPDCGGAIKIQIYSPYVIVNKTDLPLSILPTPHAQSTVSSDMAPRSITRPILLSHPSRSRHEFTFKASDSFWSKSVSFKAPSLETALVLQSAKKADVNLAVSWQEGPGKYKLSKVITVVPRFFIKNRLDEAIVFREHGSPPADNSTLQPGESRAWYTSRPDHDKYLTLAYPGVNTHWSAPLNVEDIGSIHLQMRRPGQTMNDKYHLVVVDVLIEAATIFVVLSPHSGEWPFSIFNESNYVIDIGQCDVVRDRPERTYTVRPGSKFLYAWDYPASRQKKIYLRSGNNSGKVDIMEIGNLPPIQLHPGKEALSLDVRADGSTQMLTITNYKKEHSLYKLTKHLCKAGSDTPNSSKESFEALQDGEAEKLKISLDLRSVGVSIMNQGLVEVIYSTLQDLKLEYTQSTTSWAANISCGVIQIDNQLQDAEFPVLLQPTPISREVRGERKAQPTLQASVIVLNDNAHGVLFVKYASFLLQAITVKLDEAFLHAVLDLTKIQEAYWEEPESVFIPIPKGEDMLEIPDPTSVRHGQDVYFEVLELQPVILSVSFMRNMSMGDEGSSKMASHNPVAVLFNALTMALGNLGDARLQLNALGLKDVRLTMSDLQNRITYHYRQEVLRQLHRVLGSADFLGNPVGLFTNVSSGVADIFYEPWQGAIVRGDTDLAVGIAKGAASFAKKTVFGISDSMTKVTGSIGKGLSAATFDSDYQRRRMMTQRRNKPRHAISGVAAGAEAFASSLASGLEGVIMRPLEGAETDGAFGFFKGVGKGIAGVVTKPVVGVFDLASNISEGIRNTTTVFDQPAKGRVRIPRLVSMDGVLRSYSEREALGQYWLKDLGEGKYRKEYYVSHIDLPDKDEVVLLTNKRVLSFQPRKLSLSWDLDLAEEVRGVEKKDGTGIRFMTRDNTREKFVIIRDQKSLYEFYDAIRSVVVQINAEKKMDS